MVGRRGAALGFVRRAGGSCLAFRAARRGYGHEPGRCATTHEGRACRAASRGFEFGAGVGVSCRACRGSAGQP
eukprot:5690715-Alexandrium_andersonii.AAC.1